MEGPRTRQLIHAGAWSNEERGYWYQLLFNDGTSETGWLASDHDDDQGPRFELEYLIIRHRPLREGTFTMTLGESYSWTTRP